MPEQGPRCNLSAPGPGCRLLQAEGYDDILFGCPPDTVKLLSRAGERMPAAFVLPLRTFSHGRNYADLEFVVYTYLFLKQEKQTFRVVCTPDQKARILTILQETIFGPSFEDLILAFSAGDPAGARGG
ncbi:MAG: hypothetical protein N3A38_09855, partial [Planctomycetota bacterium]|nr:hypothetical protein [Planctomycetota bacterium]